MVDISNLGNSGVSGGNLPKISVPVKLDVPLPSLQRPAAAEVSVPVQQTAAPSISEQERYAKVEAAARAVASNPYPVSDQRFTIFKDIAGDYVTRVTSLVDGSVQYYPEKTLFGYVKILQLKASGAGLNTEA